MSLVDKSADQTTRRNNRLNISWYGDLNHAQQEGEDLFDSKKAALKAKNMHKSKQIYIKTNERMVQTRVNFKEQDFIIMEP